ncbi:MAG: chorismate mutase [Saprospiraceae bacterium]
MISFTEKRPFVIAGPCSAETEEQVLGTARALAAQGKTDLFRAGIWKPRTRPNSFEGVGTEGLGWLRKVKEETGLKVTTEVANKLHVYEALKYGVDVLWIGARTTVNPFSVQEIADALEGVDIPVIVKNPINPDIGLWRGAVERLQKAGITRIAGLHRGFSSFGDSNYRNPPRWQMAIEFKRMMPELPLFVDPSHICGRRDTLAAVAQQAFDLNYDGMMLEVHPNPDDAWSDAKQQITPAVFGELVDGLNLPKASSTDPDFLASLSGLRQQIDEIDEEVLNLLAERMKLAESIGTYKRNNNIAILQPSRWNSLLEEARKRGESRNLSTEFVTSLLQAIHQESINKQESIIRK